MSASHSYSVYGLCIQSELRLDGVPEGFGAPDVSVRRGRVQAQASRAPQPGCFEADAQQIFVYQPGAGFLLARYGRELIVEVPPGHDALLMQSIVLGRGLAAILHQRDVLTLHASAVATEDAALVFVGERGDGKSTTTATLVRHGFRLVTDDLLPIRHVATDPDRGESGPPLVYTGGARLKLWPASLASTGTADVAAYPRVSATLDKRYWTAEGAFDETPVPIGAVYELAFGDAFAAERYAPREAFAALNRHAFTGGLALVTEQGPGHLARVAALARTTPAFRLTRPRDLSRIDELATFVDEHATELRRSP